MAHAVLKESLIRMGTRYFRGKGTCNAAARYGKILVFCRQAIGDVIMAIPSFEALRDAYSEAHITFCTIEWNKDVAGLITAFDEVIFLDNETAMHRNVGGLFRFIRLMRKERFDAVITLDSFMFPFYFYLAGIPVRIGYEHDGEGFALTKKIKISRHAYQVENFLSLVQLAGVDISRQKPGLSVHLNSNEKEEVDHLLRRDHVLSSGPTVAVVAGGGSNPGNRIAAKNWKPEGFAGVITKLVVEHDAVIVLCGKGEEDAAIAKSVIAMSRCASDRRQHESRIVNLVNKTSLKQAAALFQRCEVVLTNDTSLMHLAAAVGAPMVSIFGPTDPANLAPRGSMHRTIATSLPCAPCYGYNGYRSCDAACMDEIGWESVYREVVALLKTGRKSRHGSENAHCR